MRRCASHISTNPHIQRLSGDGCFEPQTTIADGFMRPFAAITPTFLRPSSTSTKDAGRAADTTSKGYDDDSISRINPLAQRITRTPPRLIMRLARVAEGVPVLRRVFAAAYQRYFNGVRGHARLFCGVYADFATAACAIPVDGFQGYDNEPSAHRVSDDRFRIFPFDYPMMFWLGKLLPECRRLFDWGGNVGISYFAYRKYLFYPAALEWLVSDVPAVVAAGREIALTETAPGLRFTETLDQLAHSDILLAAGVLHFIADPVAELRLQPALPRHILLNKVPAYLLPSAVTLQNMGTAFCPNHLFNRDDLVRSFEKLGYELIDEWRAPNLSCHIPFFRQHSVPAYSGFYFRKPNNNAAPQLHASLEVRDD